MDPITHRPRRTAVAIDLLFPLLAAMMVFAMKVVSIDGLQHEDLESSVLEKVKPE